MKERSPEHPSLRHRAWIFCYVAYLFLYSSAYGSYVAVSRAVARDVLGADYTYLTYLIAAETVPSMLAIFAGAMADAFGRRHLILVGVLSAVPLALMANSPLRLYPLLAGLHVTLFTLSSPSITGTYLAATSSSGIRYSYYGIGGSLGWAIGGVIGSAIMGVFGAPASFLYSALAVVAGFVLAYICYPTHIGMGRATSFRESLKAVAHARNALVSVILALTALELMWNASSYKIRVFVNSEGLGDTLYGVIYVMVPGVLGAVLRPLAGYLSDRRSVRSMFLLSVLSYSAVFTAFTVLPPPLFLIAWFLPVYQFFDQATMMSVSRVLPRESQATAAGAMSTAWTLAGISVFAFSPFMGSATLPTINLLASSLFAASYVTGLAVGEWVRSGHE